MVQDRITKIEILMVLLALGVIASPVWHTTWIFLQKEQLKGYEIFTIITSNLGVIFLMLNLYLMKVTIEISNTNHRKEMEGVNRQIRLHHEDRRVNKFRDHMVSFSKNIYGNISNGYRRRGIYIACGKNGIIIQWRIRSLGNKGDHRLHISIRFFSSEKEKVCDILSNETWWTILVMVDFSDNSHCVVTGFKISEDCYSNGEKSLDSYAYIENVIAALDEKDYKALMLTIAVIQDSDIEDLLKFQRKLEEYEKNW